MNLLSRTEEILLLAIWRLQDQAYGVPIRKEVSRATDRTWTIGAVYAPLHRLEKKGFVITHQGPPTAERGGRSKVIYKLSISGKEPLLKIRQVHDELWIGIPTLGLKRQA